MSDIYSLDSNLSVNVGDLKQLASEVTGPDQKHALSLIFQDIAQGSHLSPAEIDSYPDNYQVSIPVRDAAFIHANANWLTGNGKLSDPSDKFNWYGHPIKTLVPADLPEKMENLHHTFMFVPGLSPLKIARGLKVTDEQRIDELLRPSPASKAISSFADGATNALSWPLGRLYKFHDANPNNTDTLQALSHVGGDIGGYLGLFGAATTGLEAVAPALSGLPVIGDLIKAAEPVAGEGKFASFMRKVIPSAFKAATATVGLNAAGGDPLTQNALMNAAGGAIGEGVNQTAIVPFLKAVKGKADKALDDLNDYQIGLFKAIHDKINGLVSKPGNVHKDLVIADLDRLHKSIDKTSHALYDKAGNTLDLSDPKKFKEVANEYLKDNPVAPGTPEASVVQLVKNHIDNLTEKPVVSPIILPPSLKGALPPEKGFTKHKLLGSTGLFSLLNKPKADFLSLLNTKLHQLVVRDRSLSDADHFYSKLFDLNTGVQNLQKMNDPDLLNHLISLDEIGKDIRYMNTDFGKEYKHILDKYGAPDMKNLMRATLAKNSLKYGVKPGEKYEILKNEHFLAMQRDIDTLRKLEKGATNPIWHLLEHIPVVGWLGGFLKNSIEKSKMHPGTIDRFLKDQNKFFKDIEERAAKYSKGYRLPALLGILFAHQMSPKGTGK